MMQGIPISKVDPRGTLIGLVMSAIVTSVIVSADDFLLREPLTVDALLVDARLDCFEWEFVAVEVDLARLLVESLLDNVRPVGRSGTT